MAEIEYRGLLPTDDVGEITELLHAAYAKHAAVGLHFVASHQSVEVTRERLDEGETFVATSNGELVGIITLGLGAATAKSEQSTQREDYYRRPGVADFGQFAVSPAHQGLGIGSRLIEMVEERARELGMSELAPNTSEQAHDLIAMYEKKGYRIVGHVKWPEVNYRSVILSKTL